MEVQFECGCGSKEKDIVKEYPEFELVGYHKCVDWSDFSEHVPELDEYEWKRSSILPIVNEVKTLNVRHPFACHSNTNFWALYTPSRRGVGYDRCGTDPYMDDPKLVENSAFVNCLLNDVIISDEHSAWVKVSIVEVIKLSDATKRLSPRKPEHEYNFYSLGDPTEIRRYYENWVFSGWNGAGDLGEWSVHIKEANTIHCILFASWAYHTDIVYFGNLMYDSAKIYEK